MIPVQHDVEYFDLEGIQQGLYSMIMPIQIPKKMAGIAARSHNASPIAMAGGSTKVHCAASATPIIIVR